MNDLQREFYYAMFPVYAQVARRIIHSKYVFSKIKQARKKHQCSLCQEDTISNGRDYHGDIYPKERYCYLNTGDGPSPNVSHWRTYKLCASCEVKVFNLLRFRPRVAL